MNAMEFQRWLSAHGQPVVQDGICGPKTRSAIVAAFTNPCAPSITPSDVIALAKRLDCTVSQLAAVAEVESGGNAYDRDGRPKMLFERHLFHRLTDGRFTPAIFSNPTAGGYNLDSWQKLTLAACREVDAAFAAASWGKFQILGTHWSALGYATPLEMAYSAVTGEAAHYEMLARYVEVFGLKPALARLSADPADNEAFAKLYNGPGFRRFDYHTKLAEALA